MAQTHHQSTVRPGDKWDGVALTIHRVGTDWSTATVSVVLRRTARGPVIQTIAATVTPSGETFVVAFDLSGAETSKLSLGTTYAGSVIVQIPSVTPGNEPTFGPYTIFTWSLECTERVQPAAATYTVEFGSSTTFAITLNEGNTITITGGGGSGGVDSGIRVADTMTQLRALTSSATNKVCHLTGQDAAFDGLGGVYRWQPDPSSAAVDDPMTVFVPDDRAAASSGDKGYWRKYL